MTDRTELGDRIRKLPSEIQSILEKKIELWTLSLASSLSNLVANSAVSIVGVLVLLVGLFLLILALGFYLNEQFDSTYLGFLAEGAFFTCIAVVMFIWKNAPWKRSIRSSVIVNVLESTGLQPKSSLPATQHVPKLPTPKE